HNYFVTFTNMNNRRAVDVTYLLKGLLKEIKYPTSGKTEFVWQPHDYSQVVSTNRDQLIPNAGSAGGVRIYEIINFSETEELLSKKTYYYKNNFEKGVNLNTLSSSGILNVIPQYAFIFNNRPNNMQGQGGSAYHQMASFNSIGNYGYTGQGSHIGYS